MRKYLSFACLVAFGLTCFGAYAATVSRKATAKNVMNSGTKIETATTNSLIDSECQESYFGCMDSFCMLDNIAGGRCQCSNKYRDLSAQLDELIKQDEKADVISGYAADFVKLGNKADGVVDIVNQATNGNTKTENKSLSPSRWNNLFENSDDEDADEDFVDPDDISNKRGDELYLAADEMCFEQTPAKCKSSEEMLKLLYVQKIKSDCVAFDNGIKKQRTEVSSKIAGAEKSVRDAALAEFQNANKYGLGVCVKEFKKCMQTTAGCGNDFAGCVSLSAMENVSLSGTKVVIPGTYANIEISGSTMDNLVAKKVLCESVLNNCENVRDDVWDTFLKDSAYALKTAENNAESNLRETCLKNISDCYLKSCREHMDVNDPDGSYDMCLSRPENYKSFCKVELEPCLVATGGSYEQPDKSRLWLGVLSNLAAQRVDACTKEFKACLQDKDRCGEDYSQCIGLDTDDVVGICPTEKLTACYHEYNGKKETVEQTLARTAQGIIVNIKSDLQDACQNAVDEAMLRVCGDTENCNALIVGDGVGSRSLELKFCEIVGEEYKNCKQNISEISDKELGKTVRNADLSKTKNERHIYTGVMLGRIAWDQITMLPDYSGIISVDDYMNKFDFADYVDTKAKDRIRTEVGALSNAIKNAIQDVESDPKVQFCMTGRKVSGLTMDDGFEQVIGKGNKATFPNITQSARIAIINSALLAAQDNYNKKYDEIIQDNIDAEATLRDKYATIDEANVRLGLQDSARQKCIALGKREGLLQKDFREQKQKESFEYSLKTGAFTTSSSKAKTEIVRDKGDDGNLVGWSSESMYNYKIHVTTTFNMDQMICTKCMRIQECKKLKNDYCKEWKDETETCEEIQY